MVVNVYLQKNGLGILDFAKVAFCNTVEIRVWDPSIKMFLWITARCSRLPLSSNQHILPSSSAHCVSQPLAGDICWIKCDAGYVFQDGCNKMNLICDLSGRWSSNLLQCI